MLVPSLSPKSWKRGPSKWDFQCCLSLQNRYSSVTRVHFVDRSVIVSFRETLCDVYTKGRNFDKNSFPQNVRFILIVLYWTAKGSTRFTWCRNWSAILEVIFQAFRRSCQLCFSSLLLMFDFWTERRLQGSHHFAEQVLCWRSQSRLSIVLWRLCCCGFCVKFSVKGNLSNLVKNANETSLWKKEEEGGKCLRC